MKVLSIRRVDRHHWTILTETRFLGMHQRTCWLGAGDKITKRVTWSNYDTRRPANAVVAMWLNHQLTDHIRAENEKRNQRRRVDEERYKRIKDLPWS